MKKEELKIIVSVSIGLALALAFLFLSYNELDFNLENGLRSISLGISIITVFWTIYFSWGWKLPLLKLIFYRPNLNGTWYGKLDSDWVDEKGKDIPPKDFFIIIRQSFLRIHFTTFTNNYVGVSYSETFYLSKERGIKNIVYMYRKDTSLNNNEILQEGATELRLIEADMRKLEGKYWSNTKTNGTIKVQFISTLQVDSFEEAIKLNSNG